MFLEFTFNPILTLSINFLLKFNDEKKGFIGKMENYTKNNFTLHLILSSF